MRGTVENTAGGVILMLLNCTGALCDAKPTRVIFGIGLGSRQARKILAPKSPIPAKIKPLL